MEIPIRADITNLKGDLSKAVSVVSDASNQFAQAADKASARAKGGVDAILASGNSLKQQYRALSREAIDLADKYGAMDDRAIKAAQAAGEVKDKIEDTNAVINAFKADSKFTVVAGALQQAAGAASIVTGAMGLMGVKSDEAQQMILKVQSALALTQGLAALKEMEASFVALSAVMKTSVIPSLMTMNGLLLASGIGLVVAGIAALAIAVSQYNEEIEKTIQKEKELAESRKLDAKLMSDAASNQLKDRAIYIKTIAQGYERERQEILLTRDSSIQAEKDRFNESRKTYMDKARLITNTANIEKATQLELIALQEKYNKGFQPVTKELQLANVQLRSAAKGFNDMVTKDVGAGLTNAVTRAINAVPKKAFLTIEFGGVLKMQTKNFFNELYVLKEQIVGMFANIGASAGNALGQALVTGENLGEGIKQQLASLMQQIGAAMIAMGVAYKTTGIGFAYGAALVGAGLALTIAAGALSASAGSSRGGGAGGTNTMQSPTFNPNVGFGGDGVGGNNFDRFSMRTEGRDLILALQRQGSYNRRG